MLRGLTCGEMAAGGGLFEVLFEGGQACGFGLPAIELGVDDGGDGFAELVDLVEDRVALGWRGLDAAEPFGLAAGEDFGLDGEAEQVVVGGEIFLRAGGAAAAIDGVDEVERCVAADEFKGLGGFGGFIVGLRHEFL